MPYTNITELPERVRKYSEVVQRQWLHVFNSVYERTGSEERAFQAANAVLKGRFHKENALEKNSRQDIITSLLDELIESYEIRLVRKVVMEYGEDNMTENETKPEDMTEESLSEEQVVEQPEEESSEIQTEEETSAEEVVESEDTEESLSEESSEETEDEPVEAEEPVEDSEEVAEDVADDSQRTEEALSVLKEVRSELANVYKLQWEQAATIEQLEASKAELEKDLLASKKTIEELNRDLTAYKARDEEERVFARTKRLENLSRTYKELGQEKTIEELSALPDNVITEFENITELALRSRRTEELSAPATVPSQTVTRPVVKQSPQKAVEELSTKDVLLGVMGQLKEAQNAAGSDQQRTLKF
jgi:cation transport regulator ChaB